MSDQGPPRDRRRERQQRTKDALVERIAQLHVRWFTVEQGGSPEAWGAFAAELHTLKGEAGISGLTQITQIAHAVEDLVGLARLQASPSPELGELIARGLELVLEIAKQWPEDPPLAEAYVAIAQQARPSRPPSTVPPPVAPRPRTRSLSAPHRSMPRNESVPPGAKLDVPNKFAHATRGAVRIGADRLDHIRDLIAELQLAQARAQGATRELERVRGMVEELLRRERLPHNSFAASIVQNLIAVETKLRDDSFRVAQLVRDLSESNRELRLVPLKTLFDSLPMAVSSLARRIGRQVRLEIVGENLEVDRGVLDRLSEPLTHLLTNAIDHGIEDPDARALASKPPRGTIALRAQQKGSELVVTVADDGRGVDLVAARQQTIERGLLSEAAAQAASDDAILRTLFEVGMSTRRVATELSGRGLGLAVVWDAVFAIGGRVSVATTLGKGTSFELTVPVNISVTEMLAFRVGSGGYALPQVAIERIVELDQARVRQSGAETFVYYEAQWVPLLELAPLLGEHLDQAPRPALAIVRHGRELVALAGGSAYEQRQDIVRSMGGLLEHYAVCSGVVMRENGSMVLVLNIAALLAREPTRASLRTPAVARTKTVLIADDSPIIRDLVGETLRAHGVVVVEAADGQEALAKALTLEHLDLVVSDVEMPRMSGIELVAALRASPSLPRVPVIMLSMRGSESDKQRAIAVGADAYLVKSDFSHTALWQLAQRFLGAP